MSSLLPAPYPTTAQKRGAARPEDERGWGSGRSCLWNGAIGTRRDEQSEERFQAVYSG